MSGTLDFVDARRQSRAALHGTWLDGGTLEIYSGTRPEIGGAITDQILLCTFDLADPAGVATDGVFVGTLPPNALIMADGTAAWARAKDAADGLVWDSDAGVTGSGNAVELANISLVSGAYAQMTQLAVLEI